MAAQRLARLFNNEFDNDPFYKLPVLKVLSPGQQFSPLGALRSRPSALPISRRAP
jgi:hypothetical protein